MDDTSIFARWLTGGAAPRQALAYQMSYAAKTDVAMILPLPVIPGSGEDAVVFLNLEKEPKLFEKLDRLYPPPPKAAASGGYFSAPGARNLAVTRVGSFEASFVPSLADFAGLDPRFRLEPKVWKKLPQYRDWGFAVFKLRKDATTIHPMAFSFPNGQPKAGLFFPTVHIHDGEVHEREHFSHSLYCQIPQANRPPSGWDESVRLPSVYGNLRDAGLLNPTGHVYRKKLYGELPNTDTYA